MSIQPNRVLTRIIEQVDQSDWPSLRSKVHSSTDGAEWIRVIATPSHQRYATPIHFWVHALREDLTARERREDLVGSAGHALCRNQSLEDWRAEIAEELLPCESPGPAARIYRMLASDCRRSSVATAGDWLIAHFWSHGSGESWRREGRQS